MFLKIKYFNYSKRCNLNKNLPDSANSYDVDVHIKVSKRGDDGQSWRKYTCHLAFKILFGLAENKSF